MDTEELRKRTEETTRAVQFDFICTELDLARTFCRIALSVESDEKSERGTRHGEEAYSTAKRFLDDNRLSEWMWREIQPRMDQLDSFLGELRRRKPQPVDAT